ncbi:hypothetical protein [Tsukamurella tyrosinosolvens]|uniref:hypothetical protein n=1 Tax=Tsukamurella tyrosinosolvens TaxID=57704 RepID=UPI002DD41F7A|nr:hypothetical protein [Tsukamurella tyrosinosolvens]MEC4616181.1 hypothetical protein [Tsukamurella tyrosinosolvens]
MAYQQELRTIVGIPRKDMEKPGAEEILLWLARESFERAAAGELLELVTFNDVGEFDAEDVPPAQEAELGVPASEFVWREFTGIAARPRVPSMQEVLDAGGAIA